MKIKKLEISGFKSFVDRTVITFPDPITAIVGPNGCGKSNIVDAIRWCMGEQSAKHLRGRAMEDVIFSGSETRGPAGLAEVSLTFDARGLDGGAAAGGVPWGHAGPEDIVVSRRLHRDGTSEYLLGGVPCRLRDIVDFFLGTGVGTKAYSIIEQGRVGFIVSSKAEDRRSLIDEAAGITKYKAKKRLAERRMESTRQHLLRVSDVIGEIDNRLRSLRLQAQKAERYKKYRAELKDLELWQASHRFLGLFAEEKNLAAARAEVHEEHERLGVDLVAEDAEVESGRLLLSAELAELAVAKDELFALSNKAQLGLQKAQHHGEEAEQLSERAAEATREVETLNARVAEATQATQDLETQMATLASDAERAARAHAEQEGIYEGLREDLSRARAQLDDATRTAAEGRTRIARAESENEAALARRQDLARRMEAVGMDDEKAAEELARVTAEAGDLEGRLAVLRERQQSFRVERTARQAEGTRLAGEVASSEMRLETLREEAHRRRSRLQSLEEIEARYESFQRGVRAIMKRCKSREDASPTGADTAQPWTLGGSVRGLVADIVRPPRELETAVEAVLGDRLGNIVVESHDVGVEAVSYLKERSEGRSSFIPMSLGGGAPPAPEVLFDAMAALGVTATDAEGASDALAIDPDAVAEIWPQGEGVRGPLLELVGYDREYDRVARYLLGDIVVVDDLQKALGLWRSGDAARKTLVTLDGEVLDAHGVVTGGSREAATAGILGQKREMRELRELVAQIETDHAAAMNRHVELKKALSEITAALEALRTDERSADLERLGAEKDLERNRREGEQFGARRRQLAVNVEDLRKGDHQAAERLAELGVLLESEKARVAAREAEVEELRAQALALGGRLDGMVAALSDLKVAASQTAERRQSATLTLERIRREKDEQERRAAWLARSAEEQSERAEALRAEASVLQDEGSLAMAEAEARAREHGERQGAAEERSATLARREAELRALRSRVNELTERLSSLTLRWQQANLKRASIEEHVSGRYREIRLHDIVFDFHLRPPVGDSEEDRMEQLRGLIERMGEINLTAIEESEELQKRFDFLTSQRADLESAVDQLETAIAKINRASRQRFKEVFDAVNAKFQDVFPRLFGGGKARLELTSADDMLETGVEIIAEPPGKKISQNIELLSGGEKALTAVSLLFAIFLVKPSPFCILDEVDAPLDEANVGRFSQGVREMTDRSQFIVITHNKRTMEIADRLCGVTMEEPGVSKLVAVNLRGPETGRARVATAATPADEATSQVRSA
jgi:chromosome segregation protein